MGADEATTLDALIGRREILDRTDRDPWGPHGRIALPHG